MSSDNREVPRLLRQIRSLVTLTLFVLILLILMIVFPYRLSEIFVVGGGTFLFVTCWWVITAVVESASDNP